VKLIKLGLMALIISLFFIGCAQKNVASQDDMVLQVYLVRHAEKTTDKEDPDLTEAGQARADLLAELLFEKGITRIHSSDYRRTRNTAVPLAKRLGVQVEIYNPRELENMATYLKEAGGIHLVVGHSNTTPQLTELLGGNGLEPIVEAYEYDRLYTVTHKKNGEIISEMTRFGKSGP
jgi:phosphohistidine phosphatase SixA